MNKQQGFLLFLILATAVVSLFIVLPFLQYVLAGIIFAYVLYPLHDRLEPTLGETLTPVVVIVGTLATIVLPMAYIGLVLHDDLQQLQNEEPSDGLGEILDELGPMLGQEQIQAGDGQAILSNVAQETLTVLFGGPTAAFSIATQALLGLLLMVFLVYYLLKDGPAFVRWAAGIAPLDEAVTRRLLFKIDRTTRGVIVSHLAVAFLQGLLAGLGFLVVGLPNVVFWTFVMIILALLPLIGAFMVWGPATAYLWLVADSPPEAVFLGLYGLLVVSLVDNYARPLIIDKSARLNPGVIIVGVLGGLYSIGFTGLFVGPIVFGVLAATLSAFDEEYEALAYHTPPPTHPDLDGELEWLIDHGENGDRPADGTNGPPEPIISDRHLETDGATTRGRSDADSPDPNAESTGDDGIN
jgi:predicted PurR-regulated permease PerM